MNDELKATLEWLKECGENDYLFETGNSKGLLDYITNLQEQLHQASLDIQELTERDIECPSWCDKLTNLQQENERLKKQLEYLRTDEYLNQVKWERNFNETMNKELKTRMEKAVEYIDVITNKSIYESGYGKGTAITICKEHLLDILNGDNNE